MALMGKEEPEDICEHLKKVIRTMIDNNITMSHDFQGTYLTCPICGCTICLEAYDEEFTDNDIDEA